MPFFLAVGDLKNAVNVSFAGAATAAFKKNALMEQQQFPYLIIIIIIYKRYNNFPT